MLACTKGGGVVMGFYGASVMYMVVTVGGEHLLGMYLYCTCVLQTHANCLTCKMLTDLMVMATPPATIVPFIPSILPVSFIVFKPSSMCILSSIRPKLFVTLFLSPCLTLS